MKLLELLTHNTNKVINNGEFKNSAKKKTNDFTRKRKMTFETVVLFMLTRFKCSTQSALRKFFNNQNNTTNDTPPIKQQSFSEARTKIKPQAFRTLFKVSVDTMLAHCKKKWHGYRLFAIDGSKLDLPQDKVLKDYFGTIGRNAASACAQGSLLYDVLNDIVIDAAIAPLTCDERTLALSHLDNCKTQIPKEEEKLVLFDRGYASFELISKLETDGFYYVMRVRKKFNRDIDAQTESDGCVLLFERDLVLERVQSGGAIEVRVVKFLLDSGEQEVLLTNLFDGGLGVGDFKGLYFLRWSVESKYGVAKGKLQVENFTARAVDGVVQDFYASLYLVNAVACAVYDVQMGIEAERVGRVNKYRYRVNVNELVGVFKDRLVLVLTMDLAEEQVLLVEGILKEIARFVVPVRENRLVPRNSFPRKVNFHHNRKVNC